MRAVGDQSARHLEVDEKKATGSSPREARMLWKRIGNGQKKEPTSFRERAPTSDFGNVSIAVF